MPGMRTTLILTTLAVAAPLAACGTSGDDGAGKADPEQAALKFAKCMREHGVNMPDPQVSADGGGTRVTFSQKAGDNPRTLDSAQKACARYMRAAAPEISPEQQEKMRDAALKFARCMRAKGIDVPDPTFNKDGGTLIRVGGGKGPGNDPSRNPRFQEAQQECSKLMPGPKGERGDGPGGGPEVAVPVP
jgi:hypothetical protein